MRPKTGELRKLALRTRPTDTDVDTELYKAIHGLYERHVGDVDRWVRRLGGPSIDAPDLIQDVFVVALRRWHTFRSESSERTWLFGIAQNLVKTRRRKDAVRKWLMSAYRAEDAIPIPDCNDLDVLERQQREATLYAAMNDLSDKYRTALVLYEMENYSGQDIAAILQIDISVVWVRLHRARHQLRAALAKRGLL